jgi:transcriptional regulator with XRE-family HTH domain
MINKRKNQPDPENLQENTKKVPLRQIREELNMTQAQLAVALGIDTSTVSRAERGLSEPSFTVLQFKRLCQLTKKLPTDFPDFLGKEDN